ncbi:MAG: efflux RND transporter permease subunit [Deltaproteobacteria bacterium]|nr:efflux RND transporter permease subunit [Deltaproteobacteria bacterium]
MNENMGSSSNAKSFGLGLAGLLARAFINSKITPVIIIGTILIGIAVIAILPREEEPQIKVPMFDVFLQMPGFSAKEVEERATRPMEKLLWEIPGVEYIYSMSQLGQALTIVRFKVGEDIESSLVKLNQKLQSNYDRIPPGVSFPLIKVRSIDDVPVLALTFHSSLYDHQTLRRLVSQIDEQIKQIENVGETTIIGGARRQLRILIDPVKLAARNLTLSSIVPIIQQANKQYVSGSLTNNNSEILIETGAFLSSADDLGNLVLGVYNGRPVYVRDVAEVTDGAEELRQYVIFGANYNIQQHQDPAVTISIAKRPGSNATDLTRTILAKVNTLKDQFIPPEVNLTVTRNYGETASEKSNELLYHMALAIISVSLLILFILGWRESLIVTIAIPATLSLTLAIFYVYGFTLNRITLFALIFSIGILVDDAIVVVENIVRHFQLNKDKSKSSSDLAIIALNEVGNPTILATFAVIAAVLPMALVGGLMGPYMRPIPIGATAAMLFSLLVAFIVTPWAAIRILSWGKKYRVKDLSSEHKEDLFTIFYRHLMASLIENSKYRRFFFVSIFVLLLGVLYTVCNRTVQVKMLPFDNKSELQIIINTPEGTALERTLQVASEIAIEVSREPEIRDYQIYVGTASPYNFNGLVRHYYLRNKSNHADLHINLVPKSERSAQSHEIAKRIRPIVSAIASKYLARYTVAEIPPGPPVLQTLVAEIYGQSEEERLRFADKVKEILAATPGVVDIDWYVESEQPRARFQINREKAALHGITTESISRTLKLAVDGTVVDLAHVDTEKEDLNITIQLPIDKRTAFEDLLSLNVRSGDANALPEPLAHGKLLPLVPLRELVTVERDFTDKTIYHKNLFPVTYVIADVAGEFESPVYAIDEINKKLANIDMTNFGNSSSDLEIYHINLPFSDRNLSIKWDGEWHITLEVFRDLGLAFSAVLVLIYVLMVGWFKSFATPLVVMAAIPFSLIGILPAHAIASAFFTATSMIGFMAGAGIVIRNSIILVDFIELRLAEGMSLSQAVIDAGAVRFRPMLLTALAVVVGASVILFDPIFQGLALSLMAGELASLLLSRMAVPLLYFELRKQ